MAQARPRLSRQDWLGAGQRVLREDGFPGLKIARLTAALDVTIGSFYHHFTDFPSYLQALADSYGSDSPKEAFAMVAHLPPRERILRLDELAEDLDIPRLDRAMRIWAQSNPGAAAAVERLDHAFLQFLASAFRDMGFRGPDARTRALAVFAAGAGREIIYSPWKVDGAERERFLTLLCRPLERRRADRKPGERPRGDSSRGDRARRPA
jgi:AcrR family transcriptional regulator